MISQICYHKSVVLAWIVVGCFLGSDSFQWNLPQRSTWTCLHASSDEDIDHTSTSLPFSIRPCQYGELRRVSNIIMDAFYPNTTAWRRLTQLAELNRLQQNFPYTDLDLHQLFVATTTVEPPSMSDDTNENDSNTPPAASSEEQIVGFVDIDARPCKTEIKLPRPYLSDLAVDPKYRRLGIAKALVAACEEFCENIPREDLWIRVEESNVGAEQLYNSLGYESTGIETTKDNKRIRTLYKSFKGLSANVTEVYNATKVD